jgi:ketosteroid isomerase-like protein
LNCGDIVANPEEKEIDMSNEVEVRTVIEQRARAVSADYRPAILAHLTRDLLMFDFVNPVRGLDDYARTWDKSRAGSVAKGGQR